MLEPPELQKLRLLSHRRPQTENGICVPDKDLQICWCSNKSFCLSIFWWLSKIFLFKKVSETDVGVADKERKRAFGQREEAADRSLSEQTVRSLSGRRVRRVINRFNTSENRQCLQCKCFRCSVILLWYLIFYSTWQCNQTNYKATRFSRLEFPGGVSQASQQDQVK